jgi:hypothetical protein
MEAEARLRVEGYTVREVGEIVRRATELQAQAGERMDQDTLEKSAAEVGIAPEYLQEAARQIRAERARAEAQRRNAILLAVGLAVLLALFLVSSHNALRAFSDASSWCRNCCRSHASMRVTSKRYSARCLRPAAASSPRARWKKRMRRIGSFKRPLRVSR